LRDGRDIALVGVGSRVLPALAAAGRLEKMGVSAAVVNARFVKPVDRDLLVSLAGCMPRIITIEENILEGGFGSAVLECLNEAEANHAKIKRLGLPARFIEQGRPEVIKAKYGIDEEGIFLAALSFMREPTFSS